jgi:hypothetical protein
LLLFLVKVPEVWQIDIKIYRIEMDYSKEFRDLVGRAIQLRWLNGDIKEGEQLFSNISKVINNQLSSTNYLSEEEHRLWIEAIALDSCTHGIQGNFDTEYFKNHNIVIRTPSEFLEVNRKLMIYLDELKTDSKKFEKHAKEKKTQDAEKINYLTELFGSCKSCDFSISNLRKFVQESKFKQAESYIRKYFAPSEKGPIE